MFEGRLALLLWLVTFTYLMIFLLLWIDLTFGLALEKSIDNHANGVAGIPPQIGMMQSNKFS